MKFTENELAFMSVLQDAPRSEFDLAIDLRQKAELMVNSFGFRGKPVVDDILNRDDISADRLRSLAFGYIKYWSEQPEYCFDGRNEASMKMCRTVVSTNGFQEAYEKYNTHPELSRAFAEGTRNTHKTLMQSITGMFGYVIAATGTELAANLLNRYGYEDWYRLAFI